MTASDATRVAIVTGAAGGLGKAVARRFLDSGDRVVLVDLNTEELADAVGGYGDRARVTKLDIRDTAACDRLVASTVKHWGRLDALVNCAAELRRQDFEEVSEESIADIFNVNFRSVFWLCRAAMRAMETHSSGRIVNVTSVGLHTGGYRITSAIYEATKGAVANLTKTLARHAAQKGILVNSVAPGAMRTPMLTAETPPEVLQDIERDIPLGRMAEPGEVAEVIAFLASERNTYVTGSAFDANGGVAMT